MEEKSTTEMGSADGSMGRTYSEDESGFCATNETSSNQTAPWRTSASIGRYERADRAATACSVDRFERADSAATACCTRCFERAGGAATPCCIGTSARATANHSSAGASADGGTTNGWLRW